MPPRAFMPLALAAQCRGWADGGRISGGGRAPRSVPAMNQTCVMCKPDAVERGLVGEIVARLERKGLTLVAAELRTADTALAEEHYAEPSDKPFFGEPVTFIHRSPVFPMVVEGPADNTFLLVRKQIGSASERERGEQFGVI